MVTEHSSEVEQLIASLRTVLPDPETFYPLHEPEFNEKCWIYVKECLDSGWVSSVGSYVDRFEKTVCDLVGCRHAVALVNGTAALHLALEVAGVQAGDEVLVPDLTFVATANAVSHCGAVPHFVDSDAITLGVDPYKLDQYLSEHAECIQGRCINKQTGRVIRSLIVMHVFGFPAQMEALQNIARKWCLELVEDAAEALGSEYQGRWIGADSRLAVFSFNGNKIVTTGGGGVLVTNDDHFAKQARHLSTTAKRPHKWAFVHDNVAYNYRLPNLNAALGCAQLEALPDLLNRKHRLMEKYECALKGSSFVSLMKPQVGSHANHWLNTIVLQSPNIGVRDQILEATNDQGIMTRPVWDLMHTLPMYLDAPRMGDLSEAVRANQSIINVPSSASLGRE